MVMWNQSIRCSLLGCKYAWTRRTSSPPSDMKTTCWFSCIPCDFITSHSRRWFLVIGLHEAETLRRWNRVIFRASEGHHAAAGDHFKPALLVSSSHIATIDPHGHGPIRKWLLIFRIFRAHKGIARPFFAQLRLHSLGDRLQVLAYGFMIRRLTDREHFLQ